MWDVCEICSGAKRTSEVLRNFWEEEVERAASVRLFWGLDDRKVDNSRRLLTSVVHENLRTLGLPRTLDGIEMTTGRAVQELYPALTRSLEN